MTSDTKLRRQNTSSILNIAIILAIIIISHIFKKLQKHSSIVTIFFQSSNLRRTLTICTEGVLKNFLSENLNNFFCLKFSKHAVF